MLIFSYLGMFVDSVASLESCIEKSADGSYTCTVCGKTVRDRSAARNHVEALHIPSQGHNCPDCGRFLKTKNALRNHVWRVHKMNN